MPNIAALLKSEIARVARKEIRVETQALRKAAGTYRSEIAELKRRLLVAEQELRRLSMVCLKSSSSPGVAEAPTPEVRFSAKGLASHRKRLGLSAADCGLLIGASELSVYKWERGPTRPRAKYLPAIAAFRSLGKKEAAERLSSLR